MELLVEWTALVCALENRPLSDFTTAFTTLRPILTIVNFYFPRTHSAFIQANGEYLPWIHQTAADGGEPVRLIDVRVTIGRLALLATRIFRSNDRVEVSTFLTWLMFNRPLL